MRPELITHKNPKSPNSEIFRTLRTNIQFMDAKKKLKTLLVTSTFPAEGKSWVASNLAVTFAQAGKKVVLVDADMRKGRLYRIFEVSPKPGMSNYLAEAEVDDNGRSTVDIASYMQETEVPNLYIIPAGNVPPNPSELLVSTPMIKLLEDLKKICDLVIIDGTPCELVTDSIILSRIVDSTLIVAGYKITKKDALDRVIKNIQNVGGNIAGVVLNKMAIPSAKRYNSQYYYYGDHPKKTDKKNPINNLKVKMPKKPIINQNELENNISELYKDMDYNEIMNYERENNSIEGHNKAEQDVQKTENQSATQEAQNTEYQNTVQYAQSVYQEAYNNEPKKETQGVYNNQPQNVAQEVYNNQPQNVAQEVYNNQSQNVAQEVYNNQPQNVAQEVYYSQPQNVAPEKNYIPYEETTNKIQQHETENIEVQNQGEKDILQKTNEIMKQINDYLNEEKKNLL